MAARIPGHRMPPIQALHPDGSVCEHPTAPSGKPRDPGCTGRARYRASCECGWEQHDTIRESLKYARERHKTQATASGKPAAPAGPAANTRTIPITHKNRTVDVPYNPDWPLSRLLAEAVRAHGMRFAKNAHLRLHRDDFPLAGDHPVHTTGIGPGVTVTLKAPGT